MKTFEKILKLSVITSVFSNYAGILFMGMSLMFNLAATIDGQLPNYDFFWFGFYMTLISAISTSLFVIICSEVSNISISRAFVKINKLSISWITKYSS